MNTKLFKKLAEQAGIDLGNGQSYKIENFADLVAAAEREACAKVCRTLAHEALEWSRTAVDCFEEAENMILARGNE